MLAAWRGVPRWIQAPTSNLPAQPGTHRDLGRWRVCCDTSDVNELVPCINHLPPHLEATFLSGAQIQ